MAKRKKAAPKSKGFIGWLCDKPAKKNKSVKKMETQAKWGAAIVLGCVVAAGAVGGGPAESTGNGGTSKSPSTELAASKSASKPSAGECNKGRFMREDEKEIARKCWAPLIAKYGKWNRTSAFNVLWCESKGWQDAHNKQTVKLPDGSRKTAEGLFQILGGPHDPEANVKLAAEMYAARGWQPWECKP